MAAWLTFWRDWDGRPTKRVMIAYKAGMTILMPRALAAAALAAGAAANATDGEIHAARQSADENGGAAKSGARRRGQ
jgi:hypothetical protein